MNAKDTLGISEEERKARNTALWQSMGTLNAIAPSARATAASVNPAAEKLYSPTGMSEWKRGQINKRTSSTTGSFNNALSGSRLRARTAGFGYEQPAEQMGETNIENARAAALADIPGTVEAESIPIELQAMNTRLQSGAQEVGAYGTAAAGKLGVAGEYSPESYYNTAVQEDEAAKERKSKLWQSLIGAASGIGSSFATGGLSTMLK